MKVRICFDILRHAGGIFAKKLERENILNFCGHFVLGNATNDNNE